MNHISAAEYREGAAKPKQWTPWGRQELPKRASEKQIHAAIAEYLGWALPDSAMFFHPMQNPRSAKAGAQFKKMGMKAGIPDICILRSCGRVYFIEVKKNGGKLTLPQTAFRMWCVEYGIPHTVARSVEDVRGFLAEHDFELRDAA